MKTAFEYYASEFRYKGLEGRKIVLNKPKKCNNCGHKILKVGGDYETKDK